MERKYANGEYRECAVCHRSNEETTVLWYSAYQKPLCGKHFAQLYRLGRTLERTHYDGNEYVLCEDHAEIILRDKDYNIVGKAIIDLEDVEKCKKHKWFLSKESKNNLPYVIGKDKTNRRNIWLHRFIMDYAGPLDIDHINRNTFDNRKENLRIADRTINNSNRSFAGVTKSEDKFMARISRYNKKYYLGVYETQQEAEAAVASARKEYKSDPEAFEEKYNKIRQMKGPVKWIA